MPRRTNPFQQLTASILATFHGTDYIVEESILVETLKTGLIREIDIEIINSRNPKDRILVECRDHKRKQDVIWIDSLDGKARNLGYKKIVAVSASGFAKTAEREAKARGIETLHLREAETREWKKWLFAIEKIDLVFDYEPIIKNINMVFPPGINAPTFNGIPTSDISLYRQSTPKDKNKLSTYIDAFLKQPEIVTHIRKYNKENTPNSYTFTALSNEGIICILPNNNHVPVDKIIITLESKQVSLKVPLEHVRLGESKFLVGETPITTDGEKTKIILEEKEGLVKIDLQTYKRRDLERDKEPK